MLLNWTIRILERVRISKGERAKLGFWQRRHGISSVEEFFFCHGVLRSLKEWKIRVLGFVICWAFKMTK